MLIANRVDHPKWWLLGKDTGFRMAQRRRADEVEMVRAGADLGSTGALDPFCYHRSHRPAGCNAHRPWAETKILGVLLPEPRVPTVA